MLDVATTDGAIRRFEVFGQWRRMADYDSAAVFQAIPNLATIPASRHQANVSFATSSNRAMFVTNYCAIVLDCNNGSRVATFDGRLERLGAISPDGRKAIAITDGSPRTMKVIDSQNGLATDVPLPGFSFVQALAVSADSTTAFVAYKDCTIQAIDLVNARQLWTVPSRQQILKSLAVSPDGATFISASEDGTLRFRSTSDGRELRELATGANLISAAAFSPLGDRILSGGAAQNGVFVWDLSRPGR
jgi:WD40 repeat protein